MLPGPPCRWGRHPNAVVMRTRRVLAELRRQEAWFAALWPERWAVLGDVEAMRDAVDRHHESESNEGLTPHNEVDEDDIATDEDPPPLIH